MNTHRVLLLKKIEQLFNVSDKVLIEQQQANMKYLDNNKRSICPFSFIDDLIVEGTYFNTFDVNESCIKIIEEIFNKIIQRYKITKDIDDLKYEIKIKQFINKIDYSTLSNYKNFHKFLDLLKQYGRGSLYIQVKQINNYYQSPIKYGYSSNNNLLTDSYYEYISDLTKGCSTWTECSQKIMNDLLNLTNFGTINISPLNLRRSNEDLKIAIQHQVTHFLKFLIRINAMNYRYGLYFSNKDSNDYFSKPDEWKELAVTYIQELMNLFKELNISIDCDKYLDFILIGCELKQQTIFDKEYILFLKKFQHLFYKNDIIKFFRTTYQNKKGIRNNWKILIKWFKGQFKKRFNK